MRAHTSARRGKQATGAKVCTKAAEHEGRKHSRRTRAHLRQSARTAAGRRHLPAPRRGEPNRPNSGSKSPAHTSARRANGKQAPAAQTRPGQAQKQQAAHKPGTRQRSTGRKHAKAPGAKANRQTAAEKALHTQAHGGQTGAKIRTKSAGSKTRRPRTRQRSTGRKHAKAPAQKPTGQTAAGFEKAAAPADGAARRAQKNPSEQAKFAFALLPARRGLVNRGRQKIASLFLAGTVFLLRISDFSAFRAQRRTKGGAAPFYPLQAF